MSKETRTPPEILQTAIDAQAKADKIRKKEIENVLNKSKEKRDETRTAHFTLEKIRKTRGELASMIEGIKKQGREIEPEMSQAESDLTKSEAETIGVVEEAEKFNESAIERPEIFSAVYDEAMQEDKDREERKTRSERRKKILEREKELSDENVQLVKKIDQLSVALQQRRDSLTDARRQFYKEQTKKVIELEKKDGSLLQDLSQKNRQRISELVHLWSFSDMKRVSKALSSPENITERIKLFEDAIKNAGFFESKIKRYLRDIVGWLKANLDDAKAKYEEHYKIEKDFVDFEKTCVEEDKATNQIILNNRKEINDLEKELRKL